jgi:hypothetical protein
MNSERPESTKKLYKTPELCIYGDLGEITKNVDQGNGNDNSAMFTNRKTV